MPISDQAQGLRNLAHHASAASQSAGCRTLPLRDAQSEPPAPHRARVVAVTSGKRGVGKTNILASLGLQLAKRGGRIVLIDADLNCANLHRVLGLHPQFSLEHVLRGEQRLRDVLSGAPAGPRLIAGWSELTEIGADTRETRSLLKRALGELDALADTVLIDTGAGLAPGVLSILCAVDEIVVVTTPDPTAIAEAYATIKVVNAHNPGARMMVVANMVQSLDEGAAVFERLDAIASRFLGCFLISLGSIPADANVDRAVKNKRPFLVEYPGSPAARAITQIAGELGYHKGNPGGFTGPSGFLARFCSQTRWTLTT